MKFFFKKTDYIFAFESKFSQSVEQSPLFDKYKPLLVNHCALNDKYPMDHEL